MLSRDWIASPGDGASILDHRGSLEKGSDLLKGCSSRRERLEERSPRLSYRRLLEVGGLQAGCRYQGQRPEQADCTCALLIWTVLDLLLVRRTVETRDRYDLHTLRKFAEPLCISRMTILKTSVCQCHYALPIERKETSRSSTWQIQRTVDAYHA